MRAGEGEEGEEGTGIGKGCDQGKLEGKNRMLKVFVCLSEKLSASF